MASLDFKQQELRVLAHVSNDPAMIRVYLEGQDIHSATGVSIWNLSNPNDPVTYEDFEYRRGIVELFTDENGEIVEEKLSPEYCEALFKEGKIRTTDPEEIKKDVALGKKYEEARKKAKPVNFGIAYGIQAYSLAEQLKISEQEAQSYIDVFFKKFPNVAKWMEEQKRIMRTRHYTETLLHRKRRVYPEMRSDQKWMVESGYRQGINAVIQGSSADMVKKATVDLQPLLKELDARIVMWIHDEIVFDVPEDIGMENLRRISEVMCNAIPLSTGMGSDIEVGKRWGQKMSEDDLLELMSGDDESEDF